MTTPEEKPGKWLVVVNPNAGRRKGAKDWPEISRLLTEAGFDFVASFTEKKEHALHLAMEHVMKGFRKIIVVGGDGTLNEVVNGIFRQSACPTSEVVIGMVLVGTGNDWARMYNIRGDYEKAVRALKKERKFTQDAARVVFHRGDVQEERYFVNIAGMGYDAVVAEMTNRTKAKGGGGPLIYLLNLLKGLISYRQVNMEMELDGNPAFRGRVFSMSAGICRFNGGGMMQLPNAIPDDGLLDVTVFYNATRMDVIRNLKKLYDGSFTHLPIVKTFTGRKLTISAEPSDAARLEVDGESMGHSPFSMEVIPRSITLITGKKWKENLNIDH